MATKKEKQLAILLLKERLERETGKKVVLEAQISSSKTLEEMFNKAKTIITLLNELNQETEVSESELMKLNTIPDEQYRELRFISDYLDEYSTSLNHLRNYGLE